MFCYWKKTRGKYGYGTSKECALVSATLITPASAKKRKITHISYQTTEIPKVGKVLYNLRKPWIEAELLKSSYELDFFYVAGKKWGNSPMALPLDGASLEAYEQGKEDR